MKTPEDVRRFWLEETGPAGWYAVDDDLDAAIRYKLNDFIELTLDGNNLTDDYRYRWTDDDARRNYENNHFGRIIMAGVRFEY